MGEFEEAKLHSPELPAKLGDNDKSNGAGKPVEGGEDKDKDKDEDEDEDGVENGVDKEEEPEQGPAPPPPTTNANDDDEIAPEILANAVKIGPELPKFFGRKRRIEQKANEIIEKEKTKRKWARLQVKDLTKGKKLQKPEHAGEYNIWYHKYLEFNYNEQLPIKADTRCVVARDAGDTKAIIKNPGAELCFHFAKGCCNKGRDCEYHHRAPTRDDCARTPVMYDIFGRKRHAKFKEDMGGVGCFNRDCRTLFIGNVGFLANKAIMKDDKIVRTVDAEYATEVLARHFGEWGEVEEISFKPKHACAFIRYVHRCYAEFAKAAMSDQTVDGKEIISVRWAHEDPNPNSVPHISIEDQSGFTRTTDVRAKPATQLVSEALAARGTDARQLDMGYDVPQDYEHPAENDPNIPDHMPYHPDYDAFGYNMRTHEYNPKYDPQVYRDKRQQQLRSSKRVPKPSELADPRVDQAAAYAAAAAAAAVQGQAKNGESQSAEYQEAYDKYYNYYHNYFIGLSTQPHLPGRPPRPSLADLSANSTTQKRKRRRKTAPSSSSAEAAEEGQQQGDAEGEDEGDEGEEEEESSEKKLENILDTITANRPVWLEETYAPSAGDEDVLVLYSNTRDKWRYDHHHTEIVVDDDDDEEQPDSDDDDDVLIVEPPADYVAPPRITPTPSAVKVEPTTNAVVAPVTTESSSAQTTTAAEPSTAAAAPPPFWPPPPAMLAALTVFMQSQGTGAPNITSPGPAEMTAMFQMMSAMTQAAAAPGPPGLPPFPFPFPPAAPATTTTEEADDDDEVELIS